MTNTSLKLAINTLPKDLRQELADFVEFITRKNKARLKPRLKAREFGLLKG
jgi:hypothetical protein